jgi:isopropylmalate/homocitrate/citramalate synthase
VIKNPFTYEPYPPEVVGGKRQLLIGDSSGKEVIRFKVEEALKELMKLDVKVGKDDLRVEKIQEEIQQLYDKGMRVSCISDEELRGYVEKYYLFRPIVEDVKRRKEE